MSPEIIFDPYTSLYSGATALIKSSEVRDLMSVIGRSDIISFAGGLPFIEGLPVADISAAMETKPPQITPNVTGSIRFIFFILSYFCKTRILLT